MLNYRGTQSGLVAAVWAAEVGICAKPATCFALRTQCPNEFVVGYGLDFDEEYRSIPYIGEWRAEHAGVNLQANPTRNIAVARTPARARSLHCRWLALLPPVSLAMTQISLDGAACLAHSI